MIVAVHALAVGSAIHFSSRQQALNTNSAFETNLTAQITSRPPEWDEVPDPEVKLESMPINWSGLNVVQFESFSEETPLGTVGSSSIPQLLDTKSSDMQERARRAGLEPGRPFTVVLSVEIEADGTVSGVDIARTSGVRAADIAATEYARSLHFIAGTVDHVPKAMRILLPVTLVAPTGT